MVNGGDSFSTGFLSLPATTTIIVHRLGATKVVTHMQDVSIYTTHTRLDGVDTQRLLALLALLVRKVMYIIVSNSHAT